MLTTKRALPDRTGRLRRTHSIMNLVAQHAAMVDHHSKTRCRTKTQTSVGACGAKAAPLAPAFDDASLASHENTKQDANLSAEGPRAHIATAAAQRGE
jgi:hypothetical protein